MLAVHVGDIAIGLCPCPPGAMCLVTGVVSSGTPTFIDFGTPKAKISDTVAFPCGASVISSGSPKYINSGLPTAVLGSNVSGVANGIVTTGIPTEINA